MPMLGVKQLKTYVQASYIFRSSLKQCAFEKSFNNVTRQSTICRLCFSTSNISLPFSQFSRRLFHTSISRENVGDNTNKSSENDEEVPVSLKNRILVVSIFALATALGFYYMETKKKTEKAQEREVQLSKVDIGAQDYNLIDHTGKRVSKKDFLGQWLLLYFGFTHCPDICPEELEKMSEIVDLIDADKSIPNIQPIFLSVDPERDTPKAIKNYLEEFHPKFVGLTGTNEEIKQATKAFRVYYQAGPKDDDNDYIVDHTIVMYLMNPKGNFVDYYGSRSVATDKIVSGIRTNMQNYKRLHG